MARVLYFTRDYTPHDHRFLSALAQTEHQVYYLQLERRGHTLEDRPIPPQIEQVPWKGGLQPVGWSDIPRLYFDLRRVLAKIQPDLVHAGPLQRSAFLVALTGFQPLVSMSWGYDLIQDAQRNALWRWATRYTLRRSAVMVGDCETIRQLAMAHGISTERVITFPWGVDLERFSPGPAPGSADTFTLLSTRGWEPIYGVDVIAQAFVMLANQHPELRLLMLGGGSQADLLRRIFERGGVQDQVRFPGHVSQVELPRYYRRCDIYLSASHSDGTSISLLEAMACGRPVIVSDIPGNREWVTPGKNGWLFADGNPAALAQAISQAIEQRPRLAEMGQASRQIAQERANWKRNFQHLLRAYQIALDASPRRLA